MNILPYDSRILSFGSLDEKMNREGKEGWYLKKEFLFGGEIKRRWKRKIILGEGKCIFSVQSKTGKEKWGTFLRTNNIFFARDKINIEGKGGECLEKEKMYFFAKEKNNREEKGGPFARGQSIQMIICKIPVHPDDHLQEAGWSW